MICTRIIHVGFPYNYSTHTITPGHNFSRFQQTLAAWQSMALHLLGVAVTSKQQVGDFGSSGNQKTMDYQKHIKLYNVKVHTVNQDFIKTSYSHIYI